ncbi:MAG: type III-B CRISPR module RAMP protein Cmr4 [Chthonomonadales bacterium]|nr:type III-B CRISPR module RAMP protein Cmr4 [Chthonomonadales bacterium]
MGSRTASLLYLHALTPVHCGVGQASSIVDLPVAREKATGWPVIPGSSLKGVLHDRYRAEEWAERAFGAPPAPDETGEGKRDSIAGNVTISDMRLLLLPVRSFHGTFAWVTSRLALRRFLRDADALGVAPGFEAPPADEAALLSAQTLLKGGRIYLEDLDLPARHDELAARIADAIGAAALVGPMAGCLVERLAVLPDGVFDFLCENGLEVAARVALKEDEKTVRQRGLWYEEAVPAEALFCGFLADTGRGEGRAALAGAIRSDGPLRVGGDGSVGRGLCRLAVAP